MSDFNREEFESGPPEDKSERPQGIRHLNEPDYCPYESNYPCLFYILKCTIKIKCRTKVLYSSHTLTLTNEELKK